MPEVVGFKINGSAYKYDHEHLANLPTIDATPTAGSTNAVQSGGVKTALDGLQAEIPTVDAVPTQGSSNAVSSGGVYEALQNIDVTTDTTLSISGKPADAKAVGDVLAGIEDVITPTAANLLCDILLNAFYGSEQNANIEILRYRLMYGNKPIPVSISVTYTGGSVGVGTRTSDLDGLTVTATYEDETSETVQDYSLYPDTVSELGDNTITVTYLNQTATFTVTGTEAPPAITQPTWEMYSLLPAGGISTSTSRIHSNFIDLEANTIQLASGYGLLANITKSNATGGVHWRFTDNSTTTNGGDANYISGPTSIDLASLKSYISGQSRKYVRLLLRRTDGTDPDISEGSVAITLS